MELLLKGRNGESGSVVGVRGLSVVRKFKGFATNMLANPKIEQMRSAIGYQVQVSITGLFGYGAVPPQWVKIAVRWSSRRTENTNFKVISWKMTLKDRCDSSGIFLIA